MLFRNMIAYRITQPLALEQSALEEALATKLARKCESQELSTFGFVSPYATKELVRNEQSPALSMWSDSSKAVLIACRHEEKNIPGSVIREEVGDRVKAIETEQQRKVYKKERDSIKDQVTLEFLPRAFSRSSITMAYIDLDQQLIVVDASSHKKAENLLSTLREVLGTLPVRPLSVKIAPTTTLTDWVKTSEIPAGIFMLDTCTLTDIGDDGGSVICKTQDLTTDEVKALISTGKIVTKMAIAFEDKMNFVIDDKLAISKVRFEDLLVDNSSKEAGDDMNAQLEASFILMVETNRLMLATLIEALGGEELPQAL